MKKITYRLNLGLDDDERALVQAWHRVDPQCRSLNDTVRIMVRQAARKNPVILKMAGIEFTEDGGVRPKREGDVDGE